jgi:hypothetical protein
MLFAICKFHAVDVYRELEDEWRRRRHQDSSGRLRPEIFVT